MFDTLEVEADRDPGMVDRPPEVDAEDVVDELAALCARRDRLDAQIALHLRRVGHTEAYRRDGYSSVGALLRHRMSMHPGEAHRLVIRANGLAGAPLVALAFESGALSGAQVDLLLAAEATAPRPFAAVEGHLVEMAMDTPLLTDLRRLLDHWSDQVAADDLAADRDLVRECRSLTLRRDAEMFRVSGWVDVESGERLRAVLDPGPPLPGDTRSAAARRADALMDVVNGASGRPDIIVHVTADTLLGTTSAGDDGVADPSRTPLGGITQTSYGTFLTSDEVGQLACDASITRIVFDSESQPLDVGRTRRLVTPALRAAVTARDMRCVFPGCERPPQWCDVHHLVTWANGGRTAIRNLVLLCRHHHSLVHRAGWIITGTPGHLHFFRPDGTELGVEPPPRVSSQDGPRPVFDPDRASGLPPGGLRQILATLPRLRGP
jgi:hypothetical protein